MNRLTAGIGAAWGATLLVHAARLDSGADGQTASRIEVLAIRVLGARHLAEAAALGWLGPRARRLVVLTEGVHAASMVALAAGSPRYRRAAITSAAMATLLALLTEETSRPAGRLG